MTPVLTALLHVKLIKAHKAKLHEVTRVVIDKHCSILKIILNTVHFLWGEATSLVDH